MTKAHPDILSWYRDATQKLADLLSEPQPQHDDATATALTDLLRRQATSLLALHDAAPAKSAETRTTDLIKQRLQDAASICSAKFYAYRFDCLPRHWRQMYTDALILTTFHTLLTSADELDSIVHLLDRALIVAGGATCLGDRWIEKTLRVLERAYPVRIPSHTAFSPQEPHGRPNLDVAHLVPRHQGWSVAALETYLHGTPRPIIFTDLTTSWPARTNHPWKQPSYLLSRTFGGRRLVPVEIGRSYVDVDWGQDLVPFSDFLGRFVHGPARGYLAQHDLFQQIPALRADIAVPDLCWASVPSGGRKRLDVPQLNAWFGPAGTITPLHTDGYWNLLAQVVGTKYVRLYPPWRDLRGRGTEDGIDMSNTSEVDLGAVMGWDEGDGGDEHDEERASVKKELEGGEYWECVLGEGDTLLIPLGWWHYVRSLSVSFSVSFWWD